MHVTDATNASRTMLVRLQTLDWDDELLALFGVDRGAAAAHRRLERGGGRGRAARRAGFPIAGSPATSRRRSSARAATRRARAKATYGTGSFVLVHSGRRRLAAAARPADDRGGRRLRARRRRCSSPARRCSGCATGSASSAPPPRARRSRAASSRPAGVVFVPALTGLGAPWWDADARGLVSGLTRGTTRAHLVRAALEAIAHQVADVVDALPRAAAPCCGSTAARPRTTS